MAEKKTPKPKTEKAEGQTRILITDEGYVAPAVTPENALAFSQNIQLSTPVKNIIVQIFPAAPDLIIEDISGETDEDLTAEFQALAKQVKLYPSMQLAWLETVFWGASVKSAAFEMVEGKYSITELRNLPAVNFGTAPDEGTVQNSLMPGIVTSEKGETEVWESDIEGVLTQIKNYMIITEPTAPQPGGIPYAGPCYPVIAEFNHANKAADQQITRIGAPSLFPRINAPLTKNLIEWGNHFVKKWGKSSTFVLPKEVDFPNLNMKESNTAERRLDQLTRWIESYFNPTTILAKSGPSIGGSDDNAAQIWANFIGGTQAWIEDAFEEIFAPLLVANGYEDKYIRIQLKRPTVTRSAEKREQIKTGIEGKSITVDEIRDNLDELRLKETTDEVLAELKEQYQAAMPTIGMGNVAEIPGEAAIVARTEKRLAEINDATEAAILRIVRAGE